MDQMILIVHFKSEVSRITIIDIPDYLLWTNFFEFQIYMKARRFGLKQILFSIKSNGPSCEKHLTFRLFLDDFEVLTFQVFHDDQFILGRSIKALGKTQWLQVLNFSDFLQFRNEEVVSPCLLIKGFELKHSNNIQTKSLS